MLPFVSISIVLNIHNVCLIDSTDIERVIDLENGGATIMRKSSRMMSAMSGLYEQENHTFPSQMTLQFQALRSACRFQRKYWIGAIVCGLLLIAGIVSALAIIGSPGPYPTKNYCKHCTHL